MKNSKRLTAILTTAILVSLMASSLTFAGAEIINYNVNMGKTTLNATYINSANSAQAVAKAKYGNLLNEDYAWNNYLENDPERTGFNPGPAPDRPDILWKSDDVWAPLNMTPLNSAFAAFSGKLFQAVTVRLPNGTSRPALGAFDPFTGANLWYTPLPAGQDFNTFSGSNRFHKVDDNHLVALVSPGMAMFRLSDGALLWIDRTVTPGASYHSWVVIQELQMAIGPVSQVSANDYGYSAAINFGWDLSNPDVDKGDGGRVVWQKPLLYSGNTQMAYGDGKIFYGSFVSATVYALNATTGEMLWQTKKEDAAGYAGSYSDGKLVVGCQSQHIICYNTTDGAVIWDNSEGNTRRGFNVWSHNIAYGYVYVHDLGAGDTGATRCLDLDTGEDIWRARTDMNIGYYQTAIADGKLYGRQSDQSATTGRTRIPVRFSCWDAFTGEELWSLNNAAAWPTIAYGCLFLNFNGITVCYSTAVAPKDWAMFRGNVENPGVTSGTGPMDISGGPKWTYTTGGSVTSSPVVADGKLYINSADRNVYCLDAYTGSLIWKYTTAEPTMNDFASTPAVSDGKVIIGPDDGNIYALDADTGTKLWSLDVGPYMPIYISTQFNTRSSPIINNGLIYVSSAFNNKTYCLNMNGNIQWTFTTKTPVFGSVAIENNTIYFLESAGSTNIVSPSEAYIGTGHKLRMDGTEILSFPIRCDFSPGTYDTPLPSWQTPVVVGDRMYIGVNNRYAMAFNTTNGAVLFNTLQPNILAERSHGSATYVPDSYLVARNATNGTTYTNTGGKVFSNAGPTMSCYRGDNGIQLWQAWGGWEIFSSPTFAGQRESALLYAGSESYGLTVWNATDGIPISWFTTEGGLASSPAVWDGKLYAASQDNKVYCFEDHTTQQMAISMSMDKTTVDLNNTESLTITAVLTHVTDPNQQLDDSWTRSSYRGSPPLPNASVIVTFTSPSNVDTNVTATTDDKGMATVTFTPNAKGTWKAIAWYEGKDLPTTSYGYAFSDQVPIEATQTITLPPPPPETGTNIPMEYVYAAVAVIVIVIVAAAALMLLRRRKK